MRSSPSQVFCEKTCLKIFRKKAPVMEAQLSCWPRPTTLLKTIPITGVSIATVILTLWHVYCF